MNLTDHKPVIVVVAYNRPESLRRLLFSLQLATYPHDVQLIISIDHSNIPQVAQVAEAFRWEFGEKKVRIQPERLGLKKHVLRAAREALQADSAIMLEDDLYVSKDFYLYSEQALNYYADDETIGGVSLYNHELNVHTRLPFVPLPDDSDVWFLQFPSSWGQAWTARQWNDFAGWLSHGGRDVTSADNLPDHVVGWPESSWLKYHAKYIVETGKFFVYPRISLTTNFGEQGTHTGGKLHDHQTVLSFNQPRLAMKKRSDSVAQYDSYFEVLPQCLAILNSDLAAYEFETDLYASKPLPRIRAPFILTTRPTRGAIRRFSADLRPLEANVARGLAGEGIALAPSDAVRQSLIDTYLCRIKLLSLFYPRFRPRDLFLMVLEKIVRRLGWNA